MTDWQKIESAPEGIKLDVWVWNVAALLTPLKENHP